MFYLMTLSTHFANKYIKWHVFVMTKIQVVHWDRSQTGCTSGAQWKYYIPLLDTWTQENMSGVTDWPSLNENTEPLIIQGIKMSTVDHEILPFKNLANS